MIAREYTYTAPGTGDPVDAVVEGRLTRRAFCALGLAAVAALAGGCASPEEPQPAGAEDAPASSGEPAGADAAAVLAEPVKRSVFAFNTLVSATVYGVEEDAVEACLERCGAYETLLSAHVEGSDVARVNAAAGEPVEVDLRTAAVLEAALEHAQSSQGLFDVTVGTVSLLWDFEEGVRPDDAAIKEALRHVGYQNLQVDGTTVTLSDPMARIDLGGIAKGWIAARLMDDLRAAGATGALVSLGTSSTCLMGTKPGGALWRVGLRDPLAELGSYNAVVELTDASVTSSGLYDQQFELDGERYWHILDPRTGYPAQTDMLGDTVVCADPVAGDALSTTLFVMGIDGATEWLEREHPEVAALFLDEQGAATFANGFVEACRYEAVA